MTSSELPRDTGNTLKNCVYELIDIFNYYLTSLLVWSYEEITVETNIGIALFNWTSLTSCAQFFFSLLFTANIENQITAQRIINE